VLGDGATLEWLLTGQERDSVTPPCLVAALSAGSREQFGGNLGGYLIKDKLFVILPELVHIMTIEKVHHAITRNAGHTDLDMPADS